VYIGPALRSMGCKGEGIDPARPSIYEDACFANGTPFEYDIFV